MNQYQHEITVDYSSVGFKQQTLRRQLKLLQRDHKGLKRQLQSVQQERDVLLEELRSFQRKQQEFLSQHLSKQTEKIEQLSVLLESYLAIRREDDSRVESWEISVQKDWQIQKEQLENELFFALQLSMERQQWANWEQQLMMRWQEEKLQWQAREEQLQREIAAIQQQRKNVSQYLQSVDLKVSERTKIQILVPNQPSKLSDLLQPLKIFLELQQWQKANEETFRLLLQESQRQVQQWLDQKALVSVPKTLWQAIDQLWLESSQQRFGLSIQQRIWRSLGGSVNADERVRQAFGDRIGWRYNHQWLQLADLKQSLAAPIGQFPALGLQMGGLSWPTEGFGYIKRQAFEFFLSQIDLLD